MRAWPSAAMVATACLLVAGCHPRGARVASTVESRVDLETIANRGWVLTAWGAGAQAETEPAVTLRYAAGSFTGRSGCNRYTAAVERRPGLGTIAVGAIAGTRMMCPQPIMAIETRFLAALGRVKAVERRGDRLRLLYTRDDGGDAALELRRE